MGPVLSKLNTACTTYSVNRLLTGNNKDIAQAMFLFKTKARQSVDLLQMSLRKLRVTLGEFTYNNYVNEKSMYLLGKAGHLMKLSLMCY